MAMPVAMTMALAGFGWRSLHLKICVRMLPPRSAIPCARLYILLCLLLCCFLLCCFFKDPFQLACRILTDMLVNRILQETNELLLLVLFFHPCSVSSSSFSITI